MFEHFVANPTCHYILFGACHDNGYVRLLEKYVADDALRQRIILLNSFGVGKEFASLNFSSTSFTGVFGDSPLTLTKSPVSPRSSSPSSLAKKAKVERVGSPITCTWANKAETTKFVENGKGSASLKAKDLPPHTILVDAGDRRIDVELQLSPEAVKSWNHKTKVAGVKYCRMYQLFGGCKGGCGYSHGPLSADEKLVYRSRLRREVCHVGVLCRDPKCLYGHHCSCKQNKCAFSKEMHGVEFSTARIWKKSANA